MGLDGLFQYTKIPAVHEEINFHKKDNNGRGYIRAK